MNSYVIITTQLDLNWWTLASQNGWDLPEPASSLCRRWPFRSLRRWCHDRETALRDAAMAKCGLMPSGYDRWVSYAIGRGWC